MWLAERPEEVALVTPSYQLTWRELDYHVGRLAASLYEQGLSHGEVITLIGKNQPEMVLLFLAALKIGAVTAMVMPQPLLGLRDNLTTLYRADQPKWVWFGGGSDGDARLLSDGIDNLFKIDVIDFKANIDAIRADPLPRCINGDTTATQYASIIFTSGSSGKPKAVLHTSEQHLASAQGLLSVFHFGQVDTWLLSLPIYHVSGLAIVYRWLAVGGRLKIGTGLLSHDIQGVTHASLVPTQLSRLLDSHTPLQLSHVLLGGTDIPHQLAQRCVEQGIETWLGYGMTEAASTVTAKCVNATQGVGTVLPQREVTLVGERIFIGGKTLASGYYQQGNVTPLCNAAGWFDSKDLGYWQSGELVILGRADNQFISGGESIHCEEIESRLLSHPDIEFVHVIPVYDSEFGARPIAVIRSGERPPNRAQLEQWLADRLSKFKWPILYVEIPDERFSQQGIKVSRQSVKNWFAATYPHFTVMS
jgi:O-succinylbenzoic acid--CoA ligase